MPHPRLGSTRHHDQTPSNLDPQRRRARSSHARSEATNTHLRLLTRRAYGYHGPESLIVMADLTPGGLCPPLPGRS